MATVREMQFNMATGAAGIDEQDIPLAFRMMEHMPGFAAAAGFMALRGSNTLVEGGRFDYRGGRRGKRLQSKFRVFDQAGNLSAVNQAQFIGGAPSRTNRALGKLGFDARRTGALSTRLEQRAAKKVAAGARASGRLGGLGASNFSMRGFRANFLTAKPSALTRMHSLSIFAPASKGAYSPFAVGGLASRSKKLTGYASGKMGLTAAADEAFFGPGLLSFVTAGTKIDRLETKALRGNQRALAKLGRVDQNITTLAGINNRALVNPSIVRGAQTAGMTYSQALSLSPLERGGLTASQMVGSGATQSITYGSSFYDDAIGAAVGRGTVVGPAYKGVAPINHTIGIRGNLMASSMSGQGTRYMAGYFRGAMGYASAGGLQGAALSGAEKAVAHMAAGGSKKALAMSAKTLGMAIPGLNVLATASLVYDLGKMAGEVIKSGINLARDANKSLQGSINKPLFGMGYRDTEAAATSRARGVMAIQNSRLNARSMLGSEAAMMAAHYG